MKEIVGNFLFDSDFDNGNLHKAIEVEEFQPLVNDAKLAKKHEFQDILNSIKGIKIRTIQSQDSLEFSKKEIYNNYEIGIIKRFCLWTRPDAYNSGLNIKNRTWFYFSVKECTPILTNISYDSSNENSDNKNESLLEILNLSKSSLNLTEKEPEKDNKSKKDELDTKNINNHWTILQFRIMNLNNVSRLFNAGMRPVWCSSANKTWKKITKAPLYEKVEGGLQLTFEVTVPPYTTGNIKYYFAYSVPYSYSDLQNRIISLKADYIKFNNNSNNNNNNFYDEINEAISNSKKEKNNYLKSPLQSNNNLMNKKSLMVNPKYFWEHLLDKKGNNKNEFQSKFTYNDIYFNHRVLIRSCDKLNLDLITISSTKDIILNKYEDVKISNLFPLRNEEKIHMFNYSKSNKSQSIDNILSNKKNKNSKKKIIFISARVHPGEVISSYIVDGIIEFLLRDNDIRSKMLRDKYVFKIVPMLNPDGVKDGNYRTDNKGYNLNRVYKNPNEEYHPTIWGVKQYISYLSSIADIEYYIDFHGHANKFGYFTFGNHFFKYPFNNYGDEPESSNRFLYDFISQTKSYAFAKLCSLNNKHFSILNCDFSNKNMDLYKAKPVSVYKNGKASPELTNNSNENINKKNKNKDNNNILNNIHDIEDVDESDKFSIKNEINNSTNENDDNDNDNNDDNNYSDDNINDNNINDSSINDNNIINNIKNVTDNNDTDDNNDNKYIDNDNDENDNEINDSNNKNMDNKSKENTNDNDDDDDKNNNNNNNNNNNDKYSDDKNNVKDKDGNKNNNIENENINYIPHSKVGSGRVTMYREFRIMHAYTIEANYYCSKDVHEITSSEDINCSSPTPLSKSLYIKPYSINTMMSMGHGVLVSILEMNYNPNNYDYSERKWSRLATSPLKNINNVISWAIEQSEQLLRNTCRESISFGFKKTVQQLLSYSSSSTESISQNSNYKNSKIKHAKTKIENNIRKNSKSYNNIEEKIKGNDSYINISKKSEITESKPHKFLKNRNGN